MKPPIPQGMPGAGVLDVALPMPQGGAGMREAVGAGEFARMCDALLARVRPAGAAPQMPAGGSGPGGMPRPPMGAMPGGGLRPPMPQPGPGMGPLAGAAPRPPAPGLAGFQPAAAAPAPAAAPVAAGPAAPAAAPITNAPGMGGGILPQANVDLRGVLPPLVVDMPPLRRAMGERQLYFLAPGADANLIAAPAVRKKPG